MNTDDLEILRIRSRQKAVLYWLASVLGLYVMLGALLKFLYYGVFSPVPVLSRFADLVVVVSNHLYGWSPALQVFQWLPVLSRHMFSTENAIVGLLYVLSFVLLGAARANWARASWLQRLKHEAEEQRIRDAYAGRQRSIAPVATRARSDDDDVSLDAYRREKFHDRYIAPLIVGAILLIIQWLIALQSAH